MHFPSTVLVPGLIAEFVSQASLLAGRCVVGSGPRHEGITLQIFVHSRLLANFRLAKVLFDRINVGVVLAGSRLLLDLLDRSAFLDGDRVTWTLDFLEVLQVVVRGARDVYGGTESFCETCPPLLLELAARGTAEFPPSSPVNLEVEVCGSRHPRLLPFPFISARVLPNGCRYR